ncbi:MAG: hypothetical protein A2X19_09505 [Bacteroidetes bacterium GWE2_39_28]|nr:MAG: hypothetical protein A2X19_09505 [Bacteroidetes bacterium GWE2_39_28]OFY12373.1 MAG: hypothetical protein A2X16_07260 [Bacteroidetes bacterium GWF2_39_10]OFZ12024.1 MAG: hypothetical protein A2465_08730 [Bacteroidetes bacterium RIFOXYC2_FULL_39_11]HCT94992.1 hypothetical protein [Rikenellaceae bacterium]
MDKDEMELEKYKIAIDLLKYEGVMLWQIMSAYMIVNTVFLGFISQAAFKDYKDYTFHYDPICFLAGIFGLILIVPWLGTFLRNSDYYHFRMAQSKKVEPDGWCLLRDNGEDFAKGREVQIEGKRYQIVCLGRLMRNKRAVYWMIALFGIIYSILIILFGPWWPIQILK